MTTRPPIEITPCPYVNGFSADNAGVGFIFKRYEQYSDFVLFDDGKPSRCFRFPASVRSSPDPERGGGPSIPSEAERAKRWRSLTDHLPALPPNTETSWLWSDKDIEMLRAACFRRFGESLRTESLFCIAATGIRIYLSQLQTTPDREGLIKQLEALKRADYGDIKIALENIGVDKAIAIIKGEKL